MFIAGLLLISLFTAVTSYTDEALLDQVIEMPGLAYEPAFNQFSGYIQLDGTQKHIHYWLVEAEIPNAPLVFWTNGGPGCSGLIGFMTEQGPFPERLPLGTVEALQRDIARAIAGRGVGVGNLGGNRVRRRAVRTNRPLSNQH